MKLLSYIPEETLDSERERLAKLARGRGAETTDSPGPGELMTLALEGHIKPEDLS